MSTIYGRPTRWVRFKRSLRTHTRWWVMIGVGVLLIAGATTASAAILLTGRGTVTAPALRDQGLVVDDERVSSALVPGGSADLLFRVRNPNSFPALVNRVSLGSALGKARPAGCTAKVGGPVTARSGYALPRAEQVTVPAGARVQVRVKAAFTLAPAARQGCGFTVDILVGATQSVPPTRPDTIPPRSPGASTGPSSPGPAGPSTPPPLGGDSDEPIPGDTPAGGNPPPLPD